MSLPNSSEDPLNVYEMMVRGRGGSGGENEEDYSSMTPIQTAVINGRAEEVEDYSSMTPIQTAVINGRAEEVEELIVISRLVELLPGNSYNLEGVNSSSNEGLTARHLPDHQEITTREMTTLPPPLLPPPRVVHLGEMHVQVGFVSVLTAASFGMVCNIPSSIFTGDAGGIVFKAADVIAGRLPPILYLMVLNTAVFVVSLGATVKAMWKLPFKRVLLFMSITIISVYALLVHHVMPKFWVRIGSHNFVSSAMVWLLSGAYVASPAIVYYAGSYGFPYLIRLIKALISKIKRELGFHGIGHIRP